MNRPLRILSVITWLPRGGVERYICDTYPRLNTEKFQVRQLCIKRRGELADELEERGVPVDVVPMSSRLSPAGIWKVARYMRRHKFDVVHAHMYRSNVPATIAAKLAGVPIVVTHIHSVDRWETRRQLAMDRFLCRWRSSVPCVSRCVQKDTVRQLGLDDEKAPVLYNGVDIERFDRPELREPTRESLGLSGDDVAILYTGRLVNIKNPDILTKIASEVLPQHQNAYLFVAGEGPRGDDLEATAGGLPCGDRVRFLGFRDDVPALLQATDVAISPSFKEGFSLAVIETLASGTPLVATDVGGNAEAIEDGKSGVIVAARDDEAFLKALEALVDDPERRKVLSAGAVERAQRFSLENTVSELEALYMRLSQKIAEK